MQGSLSGCRLGSAPLEGGCISREMNACATRVAGSLCAWDVVCHQGPLRSSQSSDVAAGVMRDERRGRCAQYNNQ